MKSFAGGVIESIDRNKLSGSDIDKIFEIEQDMWAYGIGECVQCVCCRKIYSKSDIFSHLGMNIKNMTVKKIRKVIGKDISCKECNEKTELIYNESYKNKIIERYQNYESYVTVYRNKVGEIVGFIDGYIGNIEDIYKNEFADHYKKIGKERIDKRISEKLGTETPESMFNFSSMGTEEKYMSFSLIFELLKVFIHSIPSKHDQILGITELDKGGNLDKVYRQMGSIELGFNEGNVGNKHDNYNSELFIIPHAIDTYKKYFSTSIRGFLKKHKSDMREVA